MRPEDPKREDQVHGSETETHHRFQQPRRRLAQAILRLGRGLSQVCQYLSLSPTQSPPPLLHLSLTEILLVLYPSWYKKNTTNGRVYLWTGSLLHLLKTLRTPRYEDYHFTYKNDDDMWAFLGNGRTAADMDGSLEALTPFIRNSDHLWEIL